MKTSFEGSSASKLYRIEIRKTDANSVEISARNRFGRTFTCWVLRNGDYWIGGSDFETSKVTFKGIVAEFLHKLKNEAQIYDERFYKFKMMVRGDGADFRPLTWGETQTRKEDTTEEPKFKTGFILLPSHFEDEE
jgi:hypothetical protein